MCVMGNVHQNQLEHPSGSLLMFIKTICYITSMALIMASCDHSGTGPNKDNEPKWTSVDERLVDNTIQCITANPLRPSEIYIGTIKGIYKSEDDGHTWTERNEGLTSRDVTTIFVHNLNADKVYCGTWAKGMFYSENGGRTWQAMPSGLPKLISAIHQPSNQSDTLWVGTSDGLYLSADGGQTWRLKWQGGRRVFTIATNPQNHRRILLGVFLIGFLQSVDGGLFWSTVNTGIRGSSGSFDCAIDFIFAPDRPDHLYAVSAGGFIYFSSDFGSKWSSLYDHMMWQGCIGFAIDPNRPEHFYMAMKNGNVYQSFDSGASWSLVGSQISGVELCSFCLVSGKKNVLYAGSKDHGLFRYEE